MADAAPQTRMGAVMIYLGDDALRRISPTLSGVKRGYAKRVAAFFTDGKDHPTWRSTGIGSDSTATAGVTVRVINTGDDMELRATVAVDIAVSAGPHRMLSMLAGFGSSPPRISASTRVQGFDEARRSTMTTLVHELRHVLSNWSLGLIPGTRRNAEDQLYAAADARFGYMDNPFERDAFLFARDWTAAHGAEVDAGAFDDLLPIGMIRSYAPK